MMADERPRFDPARALREGVRAVLNDRKRGQEPIQRSDNALYPKGSVIWRVHGDVTVMMVGGVSALLLQMLHPSALAGVWDHSDFQTNMLGRLRRTARFIATTTFADKGDALAAIERVRGIHADVVGERPDGQAYSAGDPKLLAWVHVAEVLAILWAYRKFGRADLTPEQEDAFVAQSALVAGLLGADPLPKTVKAAERLLELYRPALAVDDRTAEVARLILRPPEASALAAPGLAVLAGAAIDLLPDWARDMHGLDLPAPARIVSRFGADAMARTLRWAFERQ